MRLSPINKLLLIYAAITSPILGIYAIAPLYIFEKVNLHYSVIMFGGITASIVIIWIINIIVRNKFKYLKSWKQFFIALGFSAISHLPKIFFKPILPFDNVVAQYITYPIIITLAIQVIIWVIINSLIVNHKKKEAEEIVEHLKLANLESQKQILMQQLQPHFLFNALSVLKSLIAENPANAENYTIKLSKFLRYSINEKHNELKSLKEELEFVNDYIELQEVRFDNALQVKINIDEKYYTKSLPAFALQTLVENAIKHNAFTEKQPLNISIFAYENCIEVTNKKLLKKSVETPGIGLNNLNKRYNLINNTNIKIKDANATYSVTIQLV